MNPDFDAVLLARIEDAGLNASAPPEQRWMDGWLVRFSPGKAKRSRCINAVACGVSATPEKLALCAALYQQAGLPLVVRLTPFSQPADLDIQLAAAGMTKLDDTRVMVCRSLRSIEPPTLPDGIHIQRIDSLRFAQIVGEFRGSPASQRAAQAKRLAESPVPFVAFVVQNAHGEALACGQIATESEFVGLYDVFTASAHRSRGLSKMLCKHTLTAARGMGVTVAYLQVEGDNHAARHLYRSLGFRDAYAYHYRQAG